ncbi:hypothetical protein POSPLADRAFT_1049391 [Postia placenta MAD-698-R-SB12]|uniref:Uncharacterized protein n=1 Tax=Postia placenta MAD-698-R-SB12 TaxID=670580 RepID=A0A1X6MQM4_9APHY|nr:hypothetical protein POSPLADRAFT_1049391 [Postia placenta MAD-698-R-SB12]OSX58691.1 hypothetical protein POSPLADRAFT_1049391 [Postia placenta MAD-698-R-SB12]
MEPHDIAAAWLHGFALAAFRGDVAATVDTILPDGFLRDWLVFTWDIRSLEGHASISAYLVPTLVSTHLYNFKLDDRAGAAPETVLDVGVGAGFTFEMPHRRGRGYVRLFPSTCDITKEWKAMSLFLMVEDIKGHEELGPELGVYGGHTLSWAEPVGAGQNGLNIAARFKQWSIPTLVVEKNHRVGDNWLLYQPFPENWPTFSPRDKLADWMDQYAVSQDLVVWTDSEIKPTGYGDLRDRLRPIFGIDVIEQAGLVWGMDEEGETRGSYRPTGHPGLWYGADQGSTNRGSFDLKFAAPR